MSDRRAASYLLVVFLMIALIWAVSDSKLTSQDPLPEERLIPGRNVNMVSGITLPGGDPWLQRQNEPSMAVSTRNPLHLLAGANDYRTVDMAMSEGGLPGKAQGAMAGDAWVGIYKSFDGGESWVTSLIPGFPQDLSPEGSASPLKQFSTAADPIVRAGTNGLFYYSGMAFNRVQEKGGGSIFLARFIDNNNAEGIEGDPIKYLDTRLIDIGTTGQFIDMPRIAVDIPRGSGTVTVDGQTIPAGHVYCAYTVFLGNTDINVRSRILFRRSTDCGATWGSAIKISESQHIIQGAAFAIDPRNGAIYLAFRRFQHPSQTDSIVIAKSTDFGQTFSSPAVIASILPFDQPATDMLGDNLSDPEGPSFRTNSYPTVAVDNAGIVYVAWTERGRGPAGEARIVMSTAQDGAGWTAPAPVVDIGIDDPDYIAYQGHQFMPSLAFSQGKLALIWYDQRRDEYGALHGVWNWISDNMPVRHTTDVRCAQADPGRFPVFRASSQVSKYIWTLKPGTDDQIEQQQFDPPNYEMFKGGTTPFHGDYIEIVAAPQFVLGANGWTYNSEPSKSPLFHAVWTDNRDVRPPADGNWANYTPPASAQGVFGSKTCDSVNTQAMGMRNQNIYTSALVGGIAAASPGNSKELGDLGEYFEPENGLIPRAFAIYVKNPDGVVRVFRLSIDPEPADVDASFVEYEDLETLEVMIAPFSTIARTVFVRAPQAYAAVSLSITEIDELGGVPVPDGLTAAVVLNPDPTSPSYSPSDEYHNPNIRNMEIVSWAELNANIVNPNIRNPNIRNWDEMNPSIINPNIRNPNIRNTDIVNPNIRNADAANPNIRNVDIVNPNIRNPNIRNYTLAEFDGARISDAVFNIRNDGNTTSTYTLKTYSKEALPDEVYAQLLVYRVHYTPSADYYQQTDLPCELAEERHHELLLNIDNPNIRNPNVANPNIRNPNIRNGGLDNATFAVAPGEEIEAILRVIDFNPGAQSQFRIMQTGAAFSAQAFAESIGFAATAHAINTDDARAIEEKKVSPKTSATKLVISTASLPYGIVGTPYDAAMIADGGVPGYSWTLNSGELPPGLSLSSSGIISGTPTAAGFFSFIVRADDSGGDFDTQKFSIYVDADSTADDLAILTTSLPSGVLQHWYGATLEATGGVWPLTWSLASGALPFGLSLDESGVISGTIQTEVGQDYPTTYSFTVVVTDGAGTSSTPQPLSIYVNLWTGTFVTISGMVYSTGGAPLDGAVMRGLPNTPVTGASGIPGYYEDTVPDQWSGTVTPFYAGQTFTPASRTYAMVGTAQTGQDYNVGAVPVLVISTTSVPDGVRNAPYSAYLESTGGVSEVSWQIPAGSLPPGLNLENTEGGTGWIVGTPTAAGTFNFVATATDAASQTVSRSFAVSIADWAARWNGPANAGDYPYAIAVDTSGNSYVTGLATGSGTGYDIATAKYDGDGNPLWVVLYNGAASGDDGTRCIAVDALGYVYTSGYALGSGTENDYVTCKYDSTGHEIWVRTYNGPGNGSDKPSAIAVDASGNVYVTGDSAGVGLETATIKYDRNGNELWVARYAGSGGWAQSRALAVDPAGNVYITGNSSILSGDILTVKYDRDGNELWVAAYIGPAGGRDDGFSIALDPSGHVYVTGTTVQTGTGLDFITLKYGSGGGDPIWIATYDGGAADINDVAHEIAVDQAGNAYVTGTIGGTGEYADFATIKYGSDGSRLWVATYNGTANDRDVPSGLAFDPLGNVYVTGCSTEAGSGWDYTTIKYDASGTPLWTAKFNGPGNSGDGGEDITLDGLGNILVTGRSTGSGTAYDYATVRYLQSYPETLFITTPWLCNGYVGIPYAQAIWAFGGSGSRTWQLEPGSVLPPGLDLSPVTGILAGTPTATGVYDLVINIVDGGLTASKALSITIVEALPDLVVESLTVTPPNPTFNNLVTFTAVLRNRGIAPAGPSHMVFWLSPFYPGGDLYYDVPALAPGEFSPPYTRTYTFELVDGSDHWVQAEADNNGPEQVITESNESNNRKTVYFTVTASPDPPGGGLADGFHTGPAMLLPPSRKEGL